MIRSPLLLILLSLSRGQACSYSCPEGNYTPCIDNAYGVVGADCTGFLGCTNETQPCAGECPYQFPVLSEDGMSCDECEADGSVCPECQEGQFWCKVEGICKSISALCGGKCSLLRPVLDPIDKECYTCSETNRWCEKEGKCFNPNIEPCGEECLQWGTRYCLQSNSCVEDDIPCGPKDDKQVGGPDSQPQQAKDLCTDKIETIVKTYDGNSYVFAGENYHIAGNQGPRKISDGWPGLPGNIDAALTWKSFNDTYFFKGDKYWKFLGQSPTPGYPKQLSNWPGLPSNMDAAMEWGRNEQFSYFFKSKNFLKLNSVTGDVSVTQPTPGIDIGHWWFGCPSKMKWNVWIPVANIVR